MSDTSPAAPTAAAALTAAAGFIGANGDLTAHSYERPFGRCLEDFVVGDIYKHWPGKTITEYDDHLFSMITMNHHPLHTNDYFAAQSVQGRNVVVGNLVYSLVLGMSVPDVSGAAIANLEVETLQHKFPTFHGDTIHAETRVLDVQPSKSRTDRGIVTGSLPEGLTSPESTRAIAVPPSSPGKNDCSTAAQLSSAQSMT